jgi:hypothetical protein
MEEPGAQELHCPAAVVVLVRGDSGYSAWDAAPEFEAPKAFVQAAKRVVVHDLSGALVGRESPDHVVVAVLVRDDSGHSALAVDQVEPVQAAAAPDVGCCPTARDR